ncbi:hypothetical protein [Bradyrhizobium monzae]|uniref:hypothetical protein n=1 Tax=Bradyrhizobium sp. Oc8 TaxID=2876780 RepID=UPI001F1A13D3|nr:hypothetical protein [Bradyrhizobium sp. Oc8]
MIGFIVRKNLALFGLAIAQQIVIRVSGVTYIEFLKNVKTALFKSEAQSRLRSRCTLASAHG